VWLVALAGAGCGGDGEAEGGEGGEVPSWEQFRAAATRVVDGGEIYVVEWDHALTLDELRAYYDRMVAQGEAQPNAPHGLGEVEQDSIVNQVGGVDDVWTGGQHLRLTYCVSNAFAGNKVRAVNEMAAAARAWEAVAHVDFRYVPAHDGACTNANPNVVFAVRPWTSGGACAFFPSGGGCVPRTVVIDFADLDNNYGTIAPNVRTVGVFRHELGHVLGLRHEHTRPETGVCFENNAWRALTPYDRASTMHYPWCNGFTTSDLSITDSDAIGARRLYGASFSPADHRFLTGDVDLDGRGDVVQAWRGWGSLPTCRFTGFGFSCSNPPATLYNWGDPAQEALAGDFNGDGRTDVLQAYRKWGSLPRCLSTGAGWSCANPPATIYEHADDTDEQRFLTGRIDGDARTDVIQVYRKWGSIPTCKSTGAGWSCSNPPAAIYDSGSTEQQFLTGDVNTDGLTDVLQTYRGWGSIPMCRSTGVGWSCLNAPATIYNSGDLEQRFATGDFNGDGRADVIQTYRGWGSIPVCRSTGAGWSCSNPAATIYNSGSSEQQFLTGDFNGDGRTDVIQTYRGWGSIPLCLSTGAGWSCSNPPAAIYNSGSREQRFIATDVNGDGRTDVVQTYRGWGSYPVCFSTGAGWSCANIPAALYNPGVE
jgi:hypothetical protein